MNIIMISDRKSMKSYRLRHSYQLKNVTLADQMDFVRITPLHLIREECPSHLIAEH